MLQCNEMFLARPMRGIVGPFASEAWALSKPPDIDAVARRYLYLWPDQFRAMAADRDIAELTAKPIEVMNSGITAMASVAPPKPTQGP